MDRTSKIKQIFRFAGMTLCLLLCVWFLLPLLKRGLRVGGIFGFCVSLLGFFILKDYKKFADKGGWKKAIVRLVTSFYIIGLCWAVYLTIMMFSAQYGQPPENKNVIVLGSKVYSAERMGPALTNRINAAGKYLLDNPDSNCIVTGGQGIDEPCTEALTQKNALVRMGVEEERIFQEDTSKNTRQNLKFSMDIAGENSMGNEFVIVTQGFHMYRATLLAKSAGIKPHPLAADTDPLLLPEYYGRELMSLTKYHVQSLFLD